VSVALTVPLMLLVSLIVFAGAPRFVLVLWAVLSFVGYVLVTIFKGPARATARAMARSGPSAVFAIADFVSRVVRFLVLALVIVTLGVATAATSVVVGVVAGVTYIVVFLAVGMWKGVWTLLLVLVSFLLSLVSALNLIAIRVVEVLMAPGATVWNLITRVGWAKRLGLRPIVAFVAEVQKPRPEVRVGTGVIRT